MIARMPIPKQNTPDTMGPQRRTDFSLLNTEPLWRHFTSPTLYTGSANTVHSGFDTPATLIVEQWDCWGVRLLRSEKCGLYCTDAQNAVRGGAHCWTTQVWLASIAENDIKTFASLSHYWNKKYWEEREPLSYWGRTWGPMKVSYTVWHCAKTAIPVAWSLFHFFN